MSSVSALRSLISSGASDAEVQTAINKMASRTPLVTTPAPEFSVSAVVKKEFKTVSLSDYRGKWVVLVWYPLDFTFVCPTEILAFNDRAAEFEAINAFPMVASCDSQFTHLAWCNTPRAEGGLGELQVPMLADFTKEVATAYGVLLPDGVPLRGLFIIDPTGTVRQATINDLPVGRSVDEALRLIKAFQFVEQHGEVCPANWQPGAATMVADPAKSKEYFAKVNAAGSVSSKEEVDAIIAAGGKVVLDFWAPWCKNCKRVAPLVDEMAASRGDVRVVKINTEEAQALAVDMGVESLPAFHFYSGGSKVNTYSGSVPAKIQELFTAL